MARNHKEYYQLNDAEKRDLIQLIQQDKPLPEKYRFLLFEDKREVELVWNGKTREVCNTVLPFQSLEHVDEPRQEQLESSQVDLFDTRGRQLKGWTNKLIWGDNKLILSSLRSGGLRQQIEEAGGLKLVYIDPPFDVGADFSMDIEIGGETFHKEPNILEQIAYRDTWGKGADSFIAMIYERLILMRDLLADDGTIYVHCDWRVNSYIRLILDEIFGNSNQRNQIRWCYRGGGVPKKDFAPKHDTIFRYSRTENYIFNLDDVRIPYSDDVMRSDPSRYDKSYRSNTVYEGYKPNELGKHPEDWWTIQPIMPSDRTERVDYPTQKPIELLQRIVDASTNPDDLIADFFCGSGTTMAVAQGLRVRRKQLENGKEKLEYYRVPQRKWIGSDLSKFAIHATRKRMIQIQREQKSEGKAFRAFEVLNLGRYERQAYLNVSGRLSQEQREKALAQKEREFRELILHAYRAQPLEEDEFFHGKVSSRLVVIGPINLSVGRLFVEETITQCRKRGVTRADVLAFEFEMGLFPAVLDEAKIKGIDLTPKYIPPEVFDKRAVEKGQVVFHDISFIEATPRYVEKDKLTVQLELTDFSVYYTQEAAETALTNLKNGKSDVVCDQGRLIKLSKDKDGVVSREVLTKHWTDWVDYWAVDFDYQSRKEILRIPIQGSPEMTEVEYEEQWTGSYIFENEWQSFRTRKNRDLELWSASHTYSKPGRYTAAVKVIDIFGNDTMILVPVNVR